MESQIKTAKALLAWKQKNLHSDSHIDKNVLCDFFAENFKVIANERHYDANYDNYLDFLNKFKKNIKKLSHDVYEYLQADQVVIMPMRASVQYSNGSEKWYEAVMLLKFNDENRIIEWREVCVEINNQ